MAGVAISECRGKVIMSYSSKVEMSYRRRFANSPFPPLRTCAERRGAVSRARGSCAAERTLDSEHRSRSRQWSRRGRGARRTAVLGFQNRTFLLCCDSGHQRVSRQSDNVLFEQTRNVLLTSAKLEGGRQRTTDDEPSRTRPADGFETSAQETDHAEASLRTNEHHGAAGAAVVRKLRRMGDREVLHAVRGRPSNQKVSEASRQEAIRILSDPLYRGFGASTWRRNTR